MRRFYYIKPEIVKVCPLDGWYLISLSPDGRIGCMRCGGTEFVEKSEAEVGEFRESLRPVPPFIPDPLVSL